jgi:hypothetical protein
MKRVVTGRIYRTNDTPWRNARVLFKRVNSSFTHNTQYPADFVHALTDADGNLYSIDSNQGVVLWVNELGDVPSFYKCFLPGCDPFEFSIPAGDGSAIELGILRQGSQPVNEYSPTLINYVDSSISSSISGIQLGSTQIYSNNFNASENLSALRIVNLNTGFYASNADLEAIYSPLGLMTSSVVSGDSAKALVFGELSDVSWNWVPSPIYLGIDGNLTQTLNGSESFILEVAKVKNSFTIMLEFKDIIILNS